MLSMTMMLGSSRAISLRCARTRMAFPQFSPKALLFAVYAIATRTSLAFSTASTKTTEQNGVRFQSDDNAVGPLRGESLSYVEFFSGVGGWTMALEAALNRLSAEGREQRLQPSRIAALDHSNLCTKVFEHNFGTDKKAFQIERLSLEQVEDWRAGIWFMSPPCQPHTRQHSNQERDLEDPRSESFLHLCDLISRMDEESLPSLLVCENVIGFEASNSFQRWRTVISDRRYVVSHFHLTPTQVGIPNDRPRYYCVAVHSDRLADAPDAVHLIRDYFQDGETISEPPRISLSVPELGIGEEKEDGEESPNIPSISAFLDEQADDNALRVPKKVLDRDASWCFDIVTPNSRRSSCFTQSYGRYVRGTGSILYNDDTFRSSLLLPEERAFEGEWKEAYEISKLRYFSGPELARLFGFSEAFSFPPDCSLKQQWKLIGNSLNVGVASRLVELGLRVLK